MARGGREGERWTTALARSTSRLRAGLSLSPSNHINMTVAASTQLQSVTELLQTRAAAFPGKLEAREPPTRPSLTLAHRCATDTFILGCPDKSLNITNYTYAQLEAATDCAAHYYASVLPARAAGDSSSSKTVALLASSGYDCEYLDIESLLLWLGLMQFGIAWRRPHHRAGARSHWLRGPLRLDQ